MTSIRESFARVRERELEKRQQVVGEEIDWGEFLVSLLSSSAICRTRAKGLEVPREGEADCSGKSRDEKADRSTFRAEQISGVE